jgi:hypothetical protein
MRTNHILKGEYVHEWFEPEAGVEGKDEYRLWICAGCGKGVVEITESNHDLDLPEDESPEWHTEYFPKSTRDLLRPRRFQWLSRSLQNIYEQTIGCLNDHHLILATAGLRALLEGVCEDKKISGRDLKAKIDNLRPLVPNESVIEALHHLRFTGNEALHKLEARC